MTDYDVIILGGGAAGLGAARAAIREGASVALISDAPLGGDCTFTGCVPSKSFIEASRQGLDFAAGLERVERVVATIAFGENAEVMRQEGIDVIEARGSFVGPRSIEVEDRRIEGKNVIVATGSRPAVPPIDGLAEVPFITNEAFFDPRPQPKSVVIVGAGPIGCELGEAMARFGAQVTIVEFADRILSRYEPDASVLVEASMVRLGIDVRTSTIAQSVRHNDGRFSVDLGAESIECDEVLVATGRTPNTRGFGLDEAGVGLDRQGFIQTDDYLRTNVKGVFAVGDCNGIQMLSHAADEMGRLAAWTALRMGRKYKFDPNRIPHVVFTTPEVAAIGVLEADAPDDASVAEVAMSANDRALAANATEGFVRLIARPAKFTKHRAGGKLIGATVVGGSAGEMINEVALMMRMNAYGFRLAQTVRAYPSWSTVMQKAAARWFYEYEGESARPPRRN
ncbi:MAG: NAD(P)/FAD-dependent oxidoreductase [Acidimicrobiales bacterium]|jgi:pyruvate/2-oxoglutarate dehydrogenase complex dihydrolipoamide dehydrogenase (E3) component